MTEDVASGSAAVHVRFNGRSARPLTVGPVTPGDALPPVAVEATDAVGAELIEAHVARRRAELARLSLASRTARQRCDRAEAELAGVAAVDADGVPADLLGVVDAMLEKAMAASELALASAEREASFIVDRAMADGAEVVRRAGLDPAVLQSGRSSAVVTRSVTAPPTAAELWRTTRRTPSTRPPLAASGAGASERPGRQAPAPSPSHPAGQGPIAAAPFVPVVVPDERVAEQASAQVAAIAPTLLLDEPVVGPGAGDPGAAFDTFWQEVPGERRVRDRILRRSPKESA
jgi:hypothetical protein